MQADNASSAKKPQVGKTDVAVTVLARLLSYLRPVVLVGTALGCEGEDLDLPLR